MVKNDNIIIIAVISHPDRPVTDQHKVMNKCKVDAK